MIGYYICVGCYVYNLPWLPIVWLIISELVLAYFIRDGLVLIIFQLIVGLKKITAWQQELVARQKEAEEKEEKPGINVGEV